MGALPADLKAVTAWVMTFREAGESRELCQSKNTMKVGACAMGGGGGGGGGGSEAQAPNRKVAANPNSSFFNMFHPPSREFRYAERCSRDGIPTGASPRETMQERRVSRVRRDRNVSQFLH